MVAATLVAVTALAAVPCASADGYGAASAAEKQRMKVLIRKQFGTGALGDRMICVASRESGFNPRAYNWVGPDVGGFGYLGLFQVSSRHATVPGNAAYRLTGGDPMKLFDPLVNIKAAVLIYRMQGIAAWPVGC